MILLMETWRKFLEEECDEDEVESLATFAHSGQFRRSGSLTLCTRGLLLD